MRGLKRLSVSSNGSTWVKLRNFFPLWKYFHNLSVSSNGSTWVKHYAYRTNQEAKDAFSILERIDVGETPRALQTTTPASAFSILERIDVGETSSERVKQVLAENFQYPRTDRRG